MKENKGKCCNECTIGMLPSGCRNPHCSCHLDKCCTSCYEWSNEDGWYCGNPQCACHLETFCTSCKWKPSHLAIDCPEKQFVELHTPQATSLYTEQVEAQARSENATARAGDDLVRTAFATVPTESWKEEFARRFNDLFDEGSDYQERKYEQSVVDFISTLLEQEKQRAVEEYRERLVSRVERGIESLDIEYSPEESALAIKIYGNDKTPEYFRERHFGSNEALKYVLKIIREEK